MNLDLIDNKQLKDNLLDLESAVMAFRRMPNLNTAENIRSVLNRIFKESNCENVIYTQNLDKPFFGLNVYPIIPIADTFNLITGEDKFIVKRYYVEIDSKLLDSMKLNDSDITVAILHDVSGLVSDYNPIKKVRKLIHSYLVKTNSVLKKSDSIHYLGLLAYGVRDAMRKLTSMFDIGDMNIGIDNEFISNLMLTDQVNNVLTKLRTEGKISFSTYETPIVMLSWVLRLYNDVLRNRIDARHDIADAIDLTGSELDKREMATLVKRMGRIDDDMLLESVLDGAMHQFKISGLKGYEDDYYEIKFGANHIETEDDAYLLLAKINSRMSVIADYLTTEKNISPQNEKKYSELLSKYNALRNEIANKKVYESKTRLYVNYGFD